MKDKGSKRPLEKNGNGNSKKARVYHEEPGECGIIESISLRNFMCHDNLKFDFDPHMNFIIGENGSGKSAILTGIILALGGKSSVTGRYSNLKGFIKNGKNSAAVSVTLRNTGVQAYKPEVYGEKITVERILNLDGTGSYKIKSEDGQVISTSKEELTNILNSMDIQIDNPVAVLTQEISRGFLNLQNSKKLFELFYKGTGLQRAEEDYNRAFCEKEEAELELKQKKKAIPEIEKEVERLKTYFESSVRLLDYNKELLWAEVIEMEKQTKDFANDCEKSKKEVDDTKTLLKRSKEVYLKTCQELDKYKKDKEDCDAMHCTLRNELMKLNAKGSELSNTVREMQGSLNRLQRESDTMLEEISSLENTIRENQLRNQNTFEEERKRHGEKIKNLKEKLLELGKSVAEYEGKKNSRIQSIETLDRQIDTLQAEIQQSEYHFLNVTKEIQQLKDAVKSHINIFGPEMKNVLNDIEEADARNEFRKKPKGPIGTFLVVKNPEWNLAIEECLGSWFLRNFCCDNHHDSEKLMSILSRHYTGNKIPGTIVSEYLPTVHNIETFKAQSSYRTVYDMLEIKDPVIANCLIDQKRIESTILIADTDEAFKVMMNTPPKNCQSAYTLNGDLIIPSPFRCYSCRPRNRMSVLKSLNEEDIRNKEAELAAIIEEKNGKKNFQASIRNERHEKNREIVKLESHISKLKVEEYELYEKMKDLATNLPQKNIDDMEEELAKCKVDKGEKDQKISEQQKILSAIMIELESVRELVNQKKQELRAELDKHHELNDKICNCERKKERLFMQIEALDGKLVKIEANLIPLRKQYAEAVIKLEKATKEAENICPRIDTDRSYKALEQLLKETEEAIKKQSNCSAEDLRVRYTEMCEKLLHATEDFKNQETVLKRISEMLRVRMKKFMEIKKNTQLCVIMSFMTYLKENHFQGRLDIDLEKETLLINARPQKISSAAVAQQSTSQLSGGERSYITISFLLALWERMLIPFRILDEYDVFMDSDFRHLCVNLLINFAECRKNVQCMLLSPLELPQILDSDYIKIHKLKPPKRQRTD